jgi:uncharacterized membrane protein YphA (DoxX/SURF4 family)
MRIVTLILRTLFGLLFTIVGLNGVLMATGAEGFMPPPPEMPPAAAAFLQALMGTRYMMPLIGGTQVVAGLLLVTGLFAPLALTLLAPVVVNIVLYHHFIDPNGLVIAYVVLLLELFLAYAYGPSFRGVVDARAKPRWGRAGSAAP